MGGDPRDVPAARAAAEAAHRAVRSGEQRGPGNPSAAEDVALVARRNEPLLDMKQRTTHEDPNFMETFFKASRLHYIGTWKHRYEAFLEDLPPAPKLPAPEGGPGGERVILHVDMDCFFASVAALGRPELAGLPVAVSWSSVGGGELSSCNYLARNAGCRAGMRIARAKELCPNLIVMPYEFERYSTVAIDVYRTLHELSPHVMGVSVDEAYVDVTGLAACGRKTPREIAEDVRAKIFAKTGCVASVGSGPNRLIARLATKRAKPDGSHHVPASNASSFLASMPVAELPGVGRGTLEKLRREGICSAVGGVGPNTADPTCADVAAAPLSEASSVSESSSSVSESSSSVSWHRVHRSPKMRMSRLTASGTHSHTPASSPISTHASVAKLHDSAQLYPQLNPEWYDPGYVTTNSPGRCIMRVNGMPFCSKSVGEMSSSLCRRNSGHARHISGTMPCARISNRSRSSGATAYQNLGAP